MYVLTGATGGLGSQVLHHLLKLVHVHQIVVSLHNTSSTTADHISSLGVIVRRGDCNDPESLKSAFAGGTKLLIVSFPSIDDLERYYHHKTAIDIAMEVGIKHICYTSVAFSSDSVTAVIERASPDRDISQVKRHQIHHYTGGNIL